MKENHSAQIPGFGTLRGVVMDVSLAVIPAVKVVATQIATGNKQDVQTAGDGEFVFPFLPLGAYLLAIHTPGFVRWHEQIDLPNDGLFLEVNLTVAPEVEANVIDLTSIA